VWQRAEKLSKSVGGIHGLVKYYRCTTSPFPAFGNNKIELWAVEK
jgi:hypothetical protein